MDADTINAMNKSYYSRLAKLTEDRMADPLIRETALDVIRNEQARSVAIYSQRPIESVVEDLYGFQVKVLKQQASRGGSARKADGLTRYIEIKVAEDPDISCIKLLADIRREQPFEWLDSINDSVLEIVGANGVVKTMKVSALKDRLSRAKKTLTRSPR